MKLYTTVTYMATDLLSYESRMPNWQNSFGDIDGSKLDLTTD